MKLEFLGHDERYIVEQSLMTLFPLEKPTYDAVQPLSLIHISGNRKISSLSRRNIPFLYKYVLYLPVFFCYTVCLLMWNIVCSA